MDPYYQQNSAQMVGQQVQQQAQSQQQHQPMQLQSSGRGTGMDQQVHMVGAMPSAPSMQSAMNQPISQQQQHHLQQQQQQQHQVGSQHQSSHRQSGYQQQPATYLDQGNPALSGYGSQQVQPLPQASSRHHHGGQPPLPPTGSSQHQHHPQSSSSRYGGSREHRSNMLHQHRSSAAAISDPMMASTITDQLASASGPMTGSGSALNQLGLSAGAGYYRDQAGFYGPGEPLASASGLGYGPTAPPGGHHQSRYDSHYGMRSHRANANYPGSSGQAATTAGAYHLDRNELLMGAEQPDRALHQSLGNLHSSSEARAMRYNQDGFGQSHHFGGHQQERYLDQSVVGSHRAGSMPPLGGLASQPPETGLGSYNPLEDPLASRAQFQQDFGTGLAGGPYFGPNPHSSAGGQQSRDLYLTELRARLLEAQNSYAAVKRELETATQKLGSSMHSIKSFWSPELKKERALRKEEATKYALINDQMKLMRVEVQVSSGAAPATSGRSLSASRGASLGFLFGCENLPDHFLWSEILSAAIRTACTTLPNGISLNCKP